MATKLKLRYYGDPCLRKPAQRVKAVGPAERMIIHEMVQAMYTFDGSGLAAPQVGIDQEIFVADVGEGPFVVINPEFLHKSSQETVLDEGCLSLPKIRVNVSRPEVVRVRYLDETGRTVERDLSGLMAKVFQHESDHLHGRMVIDYATKEEKAKYKEELAYLESLYKKPASRSKAHA
jgi:peptide deformylase